MNVSSDISSPGGLADRPGTLLSRAERTVLGLRLSLALAALCLLIVAAGIRFLIPAQRGIAELVAGLAAALVAVPVFVEAWASLRHPSLHGITDRLAALALIAAWATGDLMTAAFLPIIMTIGHVLEERSMLGTTSTLPSGSRRRLSTSVSLVRARTASCAAGYRVSIWHRSRVSQSPSRLARGTRCWLGR